MSIRNCIYLAGLVIICLIAGSCRPVQTAARPSGLLSWSFQAGTNKGGITENTQMEDIPGADIDAFSGATRRGYNAGVRAAVPLKHVAFESGLEFMTNSQTFTWADDVNGFNGAHDLRVNQLMLPATLNFMLFRRHRYDGLMQVKIGHLLQYNMVSPSDLRGNIPEYRILKWSNGLVFNITFTPLRLGNGNHAGVFFEGYRGTLIYEDAYNRPEFAMPGSSYVRFGVVYRMR
jgi:hypothetical protein